MINLLIKYSGGLIRNEQQAYLVAIVITILAFILSIMIISGGGADVPNEAMKNPEYGLPEKD